MKKLSITVGIPAHNAELTIKQVLDAIALQNTNTFKFNHIYVACDGCTDKTAQIVKKVSKKNSLVTLIDDHRRIGKSSRINEFYELSNSDVFIGIDDDSVLSDNMTLATILEEFKREKVALVAPMNLPFKPKTLVGRGIAAYDYFWSKATENIDNGNNVHNHISRVSAISRKLYKKIKLPSDCQADDHYLFFICIKNGYKFVFTKKTRIYFHVAENLRDFLRQQTRWMDSTDPLPRQLGNWILPLYIVPKSAKVKALLTSFIKVPFDLSVGIFLQVLFKIFTLKYKNASIYWTRIRLDKN